MQRLLTGARIGLAAALALGTAGLAAAQSKQDTVYRYNERTEKTQTLQGKVTEDTLGGLKMIRGGDKTSEYPATDIVQVVFGDLPVGLSDGRKLVKRGEYEQAIASFQGAATDDDVREPVRAQARLESIQAMMAWGATDRSRFAGAISEADRFISDFSTSRHLPAARAMKARAAWLSGDAEAARDGYAALYEAGSAADSGYLALDVADAALQGGLAAYAAGDASKGRELMGMAENAYRAVESTRPGAASRALVGAELASLAESLSKVARGDFSGARSGLQRAMDSKESDAAKMAARLAFAKVLLNEGEVFEAKLAFAQVAAIDHSSADRRAEAMIGLADVALAEGGDDAEARAREHLQRVVKGYGDTPAAAVAAKRL